MGTQATHSSSDLFSKVIGLFNEKDSDLNYADMEKRKILVRKVEALRIEVLKCGDSIDDVTRVLDEKGVELLSEYPDGSAGVELLSQLSSEPVLALEVFRWRQRRGADIRMTTEEYSKGIKIAGRLKSTDIASQFFAEAVDEKIKSVSLYNALMGAYMFNDSVDKCQSLFEELKCDPDCSPTIVTYNILLSLFAHMMLVGHMETTFSEMKNFDLSPNLNTYNILMAGYVTAWMWDSMERTLSLMKASILDPDRTTHLIMLRGYAHSSNIPKMEETYDLVKDKFAEKDAVIIRLMITAYCKSELTDRVEKIEALLNVIPESEYRPWLNVMLIKVYAQEGLLQTMEMFIDQAFARNTVVISTHIMRAIITSYYRSNALDRFERFVTRAESSGWKICRSLYHCKMVMYGVRNRFKDMENVLNEMDACHLDPTRRTYLIMSQAYMKCGDISKVKQVCGMMFKHGYNVPMHIGSS
ncbi:unnamed protein product [Rhodiola kirilowii]